MKEKGKFKFCDYRWYNRGIQNYDLKRFTKAFNLSNANCTRNKVSHPFFVFHKDPE